MDKSGPRGSGRALEVYLVGGAVRDRLLGLPPADRDFVVVGATPEDMIARGYRRVGRDFPVFLHPQTREEYALARTERKIGPGYRGFAFHARPQVTLEEDLGRRDLTINALAEDAQGNLIDYHGGRADLERRVLRHISPAFAEDPVRLLRLAGYAARYAELGFTVAQETMALLRSMVDQGEVDALVPERVWQELAKALATARPSRFFEVLRASGALARLLPEVDRLFGIPQPEQWHPEIDTGIHTMLVLDLAARLTADPEVAFAALTHDLGKGATAPEILPSHRGHEQRGLPLIRALCGRLKAPRRFRELALVVARYHGLAHKLDELRPGTVLDLLQGLDAFRRPERFEQALGAFEADYRGRTGYQERPYPQAARLRRLAAAAGAVDTRAIAAAAPAPAQIPGSIRDARLRALQEALGRR
ncbi:MAG: multifunctional CCA addition/repair protein [Candidatus Thiosymbion ectosymbiont of Robbea hypermnestra]|nr:multifunctional CCA addition/repair protein [Candidatus Thiosymbion ectosymbiont of Robbea hypermnestra]